MIFFYLFKKEKLQDLFLKYRVMFNNNNKKKLKNCYKNNTVDGNIFIT